MHQVIQQFELKGKHEQVVEMPEGAAIINVGVQEGLAYLYAYCDPHAKRIKRHFLVLTNDEGLPEEPRHYVGTFYLSAISGPHYSRKPYVGHVFTDRKEYPL